MPYTIRDYITDLGGTPFDSEHMTEVDAYIISKIGCHNLTGIVPADGASVPLGDAVKSWFGRYRHAPGGGLGVTTSPAVPETFRRLSDTVRFRPLRLRRYVNRIDPLLEEQFSALTVDIPGGLSVVTFRGTDDTIVAWKENFNMGIADAVPAQLDAAAYLLEAASDNSAPLILAGHSKGGNLAVYAAMHAPAELRTRILAVYNFDGPGFRTSVLNSPSYLSIRSRVRTIVPQYATVGMLLFHEEEYDIVRSTRAGVHAHDGFCWEVNGSSFARCDALALRSRLFQDATAAWTDKLTTEQRAAFIEALFGLARSTGARTISDLNAHKLRQASAMARTLKHEPEVRLMLASTLKLLLRQYTQAAAATLFDR